MSKKWSATLRLPKSNFPPRPLPQDRAQHIKQCADDLYVWQKSNRPEKDKFVLHDGPPYANGNLHVGHALNKILKDMILRVKIQQGRRVDYIPGWDCHGLPIELKALENTEKPDGLTKLPPLQIRKSARNLASNTVVKQMKAFQSYGIMGDWEKRWTTMDPEYEVRQLRLFQKMVKKGLIYRKFKPVYWSPSSRTALAEAELEYRDDHVSHTAWVKFPVLESWESALGQDELKSTIPGQLCLLIWTTTPWTLPANRAIAVHDELEYCVIRHGTDGLVVAKSRLEALASSLGVDSVSDLEIVTTLMGSQLTKLQYKNRLQGNKAEPQPIFHADYVSADSGSGLVHMAPGHGMEDYEVCSSHGVPVVAPIDDEGRFTPEAYPDDPEILTSAPSVIDGGGKTVLDLLRKEGNVLSVSKYRHKYPYDWRTKKPVVVRATEQWFADVGSIKNEALAAIQDVRFIPESGKNRLSSFVQGRGEWCISRQRAWGVPIPALYDEGGNAIATEEVVDHLVSILRERGTQAWWSDAPDDPSWIPSSLPPGTYRRGTDTMDVWFDSGSSWSMMPGRADVYLEGSDQHRGWFQSSLLTRIAAGAVGDVDFLKGAPFKQLITHGFTLDQSGKKMSKSLGNIIGPDQVMDGSLLPPVKRKGIGMAHDALGPDALRLWAASSDYTRDVVIGAPSLQPIHVALIKYRTIIKMLLGSMHESARTAPLTAADQMALVQLQDTMSEVGKSFDNHEFYKAFGTINKWITNDLSSFYLEIMKDRLYCGDGGGVLEPIFNGLLRMIAPMTPLLVEEAWSHRPEWMKSDTTLIHPHQQLYTSPLLPSSSETRPVPTPLDPALLRRDLPTLLACHSAIKTALETARLDKALGSPLQSSVVIEVLDLPSSSSPPHPREDGDDNDVRSVLQRYASELDSIFVVSSVHVTTTSSDGEDNANATADANANAAAAAEKWEYRQDFQVNGVKCVAVVRPPLQHKCPRCWRYVAPKEDELCGRCHEVVEG